MTRVTRILALALFFVSVVDFGAPECGARIAVCSGHSPPPPRRAAETHRAPRQTLWSPGRLGNLAAVWNETHRNPGVNMRSLHVNENPDLTRDQLALESEPISNPKTFSTPKSEILDRLAPDWQLRLHDGIVIDHILKMINKPRPSRSHDARQSSQRFPRPLRSSDPREPSSDQVKRQA
jgi:hypothetical protein